MNSPKHSNTHKFNRNFAIIIGINKYANEKDELKAAANDAKRLAVFLGNEERKKHRGGNEWYQVLLLTDEAATHEKIAEIFKNLEEEKINFPGQTIKYHDKGENKDKTIEIPKEEPVTLQKNDRLLVYFAGHGHLSEGLQLLCQDNKNLSAKDLQNILSKLPCDHKLLILDCCYSGAARESSQKQQPLYRAPGNGNKTYNEDFIWLQRPTFTMITSGGYTQVPDGGALNPEHSPFSEALLEALKNEYFNNTVDSNNDHILTVVEIYNYIAGDNRVKQKQHPELIHITSQETISGQYFFLLPTFDPSVLTSIGNLEKPYKGLFSYEEEDKPIFCGQDELVNKLFDRVNKENQNLTIVTGASGSGKSSIVKAGLIPLLKDSYTSTTGLEKSDESNQAKQWTILAVMRPGESPLAALAKTILPIYDNNLLDEINTEIKKLPSFVSNQNLQNSTLNDKINNKVKNMSMLINDFDELTKKCGDNQQKKEQLKKLKDEANKKLNEIVLKLNQDLQQEIKVLINLIKNWTKKININNAHILLFIDQFEELITLSQSQEKENFLNLIVQLVKESKNLHIVLTVRSDFEIYFRDSSKTSDFSNSISQYWNADTRLVVEEMNSTQLRQAIMIPARRFIDNNKRMLGFESEELVSNIIDDVRGMPGGLALLSFTLDELYKMASENANKNKIIIEEKDYKKLGRVSGALTKRATEVYNNLSQAIQLPEYDKKFTKKYEQEYKDKGKGKLIPAEDESAGEVRQAMMKQLILRMVTTQGGKLAKRPVPISELQYPNWRSRYKNSTYRMCQVIDQLIQERLIVSNSYESNKGNNKEEICYVEPAHDALILYWDKLHKKNDTEQQQEQNNQVQEQGWLEEYKDNLDLRDRLINDVQKWQAQEQEQKKIQGEFLRKSKYQKQVADLSGRLADGYLKITDYAIELEIRLKFGKKLKKYFLIISSILLKLISVILGIILVIFGLSIIISGVLLLDELRESVLLAIFMLLIFMLIGIFIVLLGLLFISRKLAFKALKFLVVTIFFNFILRCYSLFRKETYNLSKRKEENEKRRK